MKKLLLVSTFIAALATQAFALDLQSARSQGLISEGSDGFVQAVDQSPEVKALVSDVNGKRQKEYERISKENGQPVDVVGRLAAEQIKNRK